MDASPLVWGARIDMVAAMLTEISDMLMAVGRDVQLINRQNPRPPRLARGCVSRYGGSGFLPIRRSETGDLLRGGCSRNQRSDGKPDAVPLCPTRIHLVFRLKSLCVIWSRCCPRCQSTEKAREDDGGDLYTRPLRTLRVINASIAFRPARLCFHQPTHPLDSSRFQKARPPKAG